ncbi:MAG: membrane protein insertase YidC, partial [Actinomycetia bacterium]|nr:membrane protein insertase YidC [Actinomycetes bacterium]
GYVLYGCYWLVRSYAWAIILFTLLTKLILLPLSAWGQRNAITMVRMRPQLDAIKRRFEGNNTLILDEQRALHKREGYSNWAAVLPLLVQVPLILGVIQVVYHPLRHLCHLGNPVIAALVQRAALLLDTTPHALGSGAQIRVIDLMATRSAEFAGAADPSVLARVGSIDLHFLGLDLGAVPSWTSWTIVWPFLAAASALALSLYQNRYYVLQRFAGPGSRWGITAFLVVFSFYFALILPGGFGLYWTTANLMSIGVVFVCNRWDDPRKLLDYAKLTPPPGPTWAQRLAKRRLARTLHARERADIAAFEGAGPKGLMIYSEGSGYWKYYARLVSWLLAHTDVTIHYVTSDPDDQVFTRTSERLRTYYVGPRALIAFMMRLDVDVCLMTTPDLEKYHLKRSLVNRTVEYIYMDHGMASLHLVLREGALDHFDTIFCYGPNHVAEMRQTEATYGLPAKRLVKTGYPLLDDLLDARADRLGAPPNDPPVALVAPSWQADNLLETCLDEVVRPLLASGFRVIVRPHPEFVKRFGEAWAGIQAGYAGTERLEFESDFSSNETVYSADIVVTDWSTIASEFSYATKRPCLFVNTPMKVMNPHYQRIAAVPLDISLRDRIGRSFDLDRLGGLGEAAAEMVAHRAAWRDRIDACLHEFIFFVGTGAETMGAYLVEALERHQRARDVAAARTAVRAGTATPAQEALLADERAQARRREIDEAETQAERLEALATQIRACVAAARAH